MKPNNKSGKGNQLKEAAVWFAGIVLAVLIILTACESHTFFERLAGDYAPYSNIGNTWEFSATGEDTFNVQWRITGRVVLGGVEAVAIEEDEAVIYLAREPDGLYEWVRTTRNFSDEVITIEERWRKRIELPFATGNTWPDSYQGEVQFMGLTYRVEAGLVGRVLGLEPVLTQADYFKDAYKIDLQITYTIIDPISGEVTEQTLVSEWYAPDVGLVRRKVVGSYEWGLRDYAIIP